LPIDSWTCQPSAVSRLFFGKCGTELLWLC